MSLSSEAKTAVAEGRSYLICELMIRLKLSRSTIYRLMEKSGVQAIKAGRSVRIPEPELEKILTYRERKETL